MFGRRILILVAHPDDEVVACAACVARARTQGATVSALYLTDGCLSEETLWPWQRKHHEDMVTRRHLEAEAAATSLGILPVGWGNRPARALWRELPIVFEEVNIAISQYKPDQIWVPAYEGGNPDHDALNAIGFKLKSRLSVLEFPEYNYFGGEMRSQTFISSGTSEHIVTLTLVERAAKRALMEIYASEKSNLSGLKLDQECYRPLTTYDYAQPPHQGTLWYTRFQWVPFRHPRVDYTSPETVSNAIVSFLS
ncbi:MAG: PIG-L family deacetylase [Alphaproteobacteria bacterium]|nr:PIG-L family deacetylase [Alphaproteobacteria bacterium]